MSANSYGWFIKGSNKKCTDGGDMFTPERLKTWETANCKVKSEDSKKVSFICNSEVKALQGEKVLYANKEDCIKDGGEYNQQEFKELKTKWKNNFSKKLWVTYKYNCPKDKNIGCEFSNKSPKDMIPDFKPLLSENGYNCASTFDVVESTDTPSKDMKMSMICVRTTDMCSWSFFWFENEKECKAFEKQQ